MTQHRCFLSLKTLLVLLPHFNFIEIPLSVILCPLKTLDLRQANQYMRWSRNFNSIVEDVDLDIDPIFPIFVTMPALN